MNGDYGISTVIMAQGVVATLDSDYLESKSLQNPEDFLPFESRQARHESDPDALDSDEVGGTQMVLLVL